MYTNRVLADVPCMMLLLQEFPHGRRNISTHFGKFVHCLGTARVLRLLLLLLVCLLAHFLLGVCIGAGATAVVLEAVGVVSLLLRLLQLRGWRRKLTTQRRARTDARTNICIYTRACAHACTPTDAHVHADTDTDTGTQTCTRKRIYTQSRTHTDKQSHPRTHRHIDTQKQRCQPQFHKKIKISTTRSRTGRRGQEKKRRWMQACPKRAGVNPCWCMCLWRKCVHYE